MTESNSTSASLFRFLDGLAENVLAIDASDTIVYANPASVQALDLREDRPAVGAPLESLFEELGDPDPDPGDSACWRDAVLHRPHRENVPARIAYFSSGDDSSDLRLVRWQTHPASPGAALSVEVLCSRFGHQFANLLTPMMGYIELARMDADPDSELAGLMASFMNICRRMILHVQNLLLLRQRPRGSKTRLDLRQILKDAIKVAEDTGLTNEHEVIVEKTDSETPLTIESEGDLPQQLLTNVIVNAAEAMNRPGRIQITIGPSGGAAEVRIVDSGPGIASLARDRLFEPFFSTKANGKGIGLGLYVSQVIAQRHGGTLRITSLQPQGTAVTVRFPLAQG